MKIVRERVGEIWRIESEPYTKTTKSGDKKETSTDSTTYDDPS